MAKASITKTVVDSAKPGSNDYFLWDEKLSGFGLKVTPKGGKIYVLQFRIAKAGKALSATAPRRRALGKHGALTPEQARVLAKKRLNYILEKGKDPWEDEAEQLVIADAEKADKAKLENEQAFSRLADAWLDHYENEKQRRASGVSYAKMVVKNHLQPALGTRPAPHITRADVQLIIDAIPAHQRATRRNVFAYSSILFGWMRRRGHIVSNPLELMEKPEAPASRDRVLNDAELSAIWKASYNLAHPFGPFIRILILTIQRRGEVAAMNWLELDRKAAVWVIPAARAKNNVAHIVPLSRAVITELDALAGGVQWPKTGYVLTTTGRSPISGISKAKRTLDRKIAEETDIPAWRLHDLRRTGATRLQGHGVRFEVTEAILNHVSGAKSGVAGVYQRHDWKAEKRAALRLFTVKLMRMLGKDLRLASAGRGAAVRVADNIANKNNQANLTSAKILSA